MLSKLGHPQSVVLLPDGPDTLQIVLTYTNGDTVFVMERGRDDWRCTKVTNQHIIELAFPNDRLAVDHATKMLTGALLAFTAPAAA